MLPICLQTWHNLAVQNAWPRPVQSPALSAKLLEAFLKNERWRVPSNMATSAMKVDIEAIKIKTNRFKVVCS